MNQKVEFYSRGNQLLRDSYDNMIVSLTRGVNGENVKVLLFCGSEPGVGTTTVAIEMAVFLAESKRRVLLIDGDMRKQNQHKRLGNLNGPGLGEYLEGKVGYHEIVTTTNQKWLDFVCRGEVSSGQHSLSMLGSSELERLLVRARGEYDFILIDSPSIEVANDAFALSFLVDGILLVAAVEQSSKASLKKATHLFGRENGKLLGVIANKVAQTKYRSYLSQYDYFCKGKYIKPRRD